MDEIELYNEALAALQGGQQTQARRLLAELVRVNPRHEQAWLRLAAAVTDSVQIADCLQRALVINPNNVTAREWLQRIQRDPAAPIQPPHAAGAAGLLDDDVLLAEPGDDERPVPRLGQYLLDYQFITGDQLKAALVIQRESIASGHPRRLGDILLEQGAIQTERLEFAVREQHRSFYSLFKD